MGAELSRELEDSLKRDHQQQQQLRPQSSQPQPQPQPQQLRPQSSQPQQQSRPQSSQPQQQQKPLRPQSPQQQLRPQSPQPQPQPKQQQARPQSSQPQPQPQPQAQAQAQAQQQQARPQSSQPQSAQQQQQVRSPQPQQQQQQPRAHEGSSSSTRDAWLLSPQSQSKELNNLPHKYEDILKDADSPVDKSSREKLLDQLYAGVFLHHKTKKYWVEKKSNANCFMMYARALSITWAEDQRYWKWVPQKEASSGTMTEVAELKRVCWLEVHGKLDTRKLSPGILYQVSFIVMLKDPAQGWEVPVNVRLTLPGGKKQQRKENLMDKLRVRWIEIPVGEFVASDQQGGVGEMEFSMYEHEGGMWKQGLVIQGVSIKPKNYD